MGKAPAFQFYAGDFLTDVMDWTDEEVGVHVRLLAWSWVNRRGIPRDTQRLTRIAPKAVEAWPVIGSKWQEGPEDTWVNDKLESTRSNSDAFRASQRERSLLAVAARQSKGKPKGKPNGKPMGSPMGNPLEDEVEVYTQERKERASIVTTKLDYDGFRERCLNVHKEVKLLSDTEAKAFFDYWTEGHPETKPRYASMDRFDIAKRMGTWKRNNFAAKSETPTTSPTLKPWMQ